MSLAQKPVVSARQAVVSAYFTDSTGVLRPERPARCPLASPADECTIVWHGWRHRKAGIDFPLALCRCKAHGLSFTVYPINFRPYARRPLVELTPEGFDIGQGAGASEGWRETAFGAAVDGSEGVRWPESAGQITAWSRLHGRMPYGVAKTQRRHIMGVNKLFALFPEQVYEHSVVASTFNETGMAFLREVSGKARDGPWHKAEGAKGAAVLSALGTPCRRLLTGIDRLGVDRSYWGPPVTIGPRKGPNIRRSYRH